jgi:hypothetical protein
MRTLLSFFLLLSAVELSAAILPKDFTPAERQRWLPALESLQSPRADFKVPIQQRWRPVHDTADFKYVLLSSEADFDEAQQLRYAIARHLPEGVKLILLVEPRMAERVRRAYAPYISQERLLLATSQNITNGFWARDAFPVPVVDDENNLSLVGAQYYRRFAAGSDIAKSLNLALQPESFTFVGGNLLADEEGRCFTVDSYRRFTSTNEDMYRAYGCRDLKVLRHVSGIGDVDEVIKPLPGRVMLANTDAYTADLESWGYRVVRMPAIANSYRTYINSLVVGRTVFMPSYGVPTDSQARAVYESQGYQVIEIRSNTLSDQLRGSIHCQTMAYPQIAEEKLLSLLGLRAVR